MYYYIFYLNSYVKYMYFLFKMFANYRGRKMVF